ncbi:MAG: glutamine amidotransferase [Mitsuaria chitosanitabida]|uniref:glutamine amidotransferase n=1 Tax=Roseateles chitosanitabidus TaxID=65048 RepID=UPI001B149D1F|nr:glutamine amidotransferase [Roseateles chitosanitabidus]MBO9685548.1 glutamine amidotransferase [Roseateles chitosanitabidus]
MPHAKTVLALRHLAFEDLGLLRPVLESQAFERFITLDAGVDDLRDVDLDAVDLLVVLGGPIGAYDDALYPCLRDELALIERRLADRSPLLGICLGAQLMARALGADVKPMAHGKKEIGYSPLWLTDAGRDSALAPLAGGQPVLHWHGDQFALPPGISSLAETPLCPHQAFAIEDYALGLQFHLEGDPARLEQWLIGHAGELAQAGVPLDQLRRDAAAHGPGLRKALSEVMARWLER